jgi:transposase
MKVVYLDDSVDIRTVRRWVARVHDANLGHASLSDKQRSGRPQTATDEDRRNRVDEMIRENRRISQQATANRTAVSRERVQEIIADLGYRKLCARFVPQMLTEDLKQKRMDIRRHLLL